MAWVVRRSFGACDPLKIPLLLAEQVSTGKELALKVISPVQAPIVRPFTYDERRPFARGQHRNVTFSTRPGQIVRAPCTGSLSLNAQWRTATIQCHRLRITLFPLEPTLPDDNAGTGRTRAATAAPAHDIQAGTQLGRAASSHLRLGVRRTNQPWGYVDPELYLKAPSLGPAPHPITPAPRVRPPATPHAPRGAPSTEAPRTTPRTPRRAPSTETPRTSAPRLPPQIAPWTSPQSSPRPPARTCTAWRGLAATLAAATTGTRLHRDRDRSSVAGHGPSRAFRILRR